MTTGVPRKSEADRDDEDVEHDRQEQRGAEVSRARYQEQQPGDHLGGSDEAPEQPGLVHGLEEGADRRLGDDRGEPAAKELDQARGNEPGREEDACEQRHPQEERLGPGPSEESIRGVREHRNRTIRAPLASVPSSSVDPGRASGLPAVASSLAHADPCHDDPDWDRWTSSFRTRMRIGKVLNGAAHAAAHRGRRHDGNEHCRERHGRAVANSCSRCPATSRECARLTGTAPRPASEPCSLHPAARSALRGGPPPRPCRGSASARSRRQNRCLERPSVNSRLESVAM